MIIVKYKGYNFINLQRENNTYSSHYTILLQNTMTKEITSYKADDTGNSMYHRFYIDLDLEDGEYYVLLFENPNRLDFYAEANSPKNTDYISYLASDDELIMNGEYFLVFGSEEEDKPELKYIKSDLLRIGVYERKNTQYQREKQYIQYNR